MRSLLKVIVLSCILFLPIHSYTSTLPYRLGLITSYWNELALKPGVTLGLDWEFKNSKGHGVAVTFPNFLFFVFPNNFFSISFYSSLSYRFVHPQNGFYTSLTMGIGLNAQYKIVPLFNLDGDQIRDPGFVRLIAIAQWDLGYDFEIKYKKPVRLFFSLGWNGIAPNNLGINSGLMIQVGVNIKLFDSAQKRRS